MISAEEGPRLFEHIVRHDRDYFDAFTTTETMMNGTVAHYHRNMTGAAETMTIRAVSYDANVDNVPAIPFGDETWRVVERNPEHSGVLTTLGYHLRFASNRSRANRFYTAFRCEPFLPSEGGLPTETDSNPTPNLRERKGCQGCHNVLEPAAASWGRWRTGSTYGYFDRTTIDFSLPRRECEDCGNDGNCRRLCETYFIVPEIAHPIELEHWRGYPQARTWLDDEEADAIDLGPRSLPR